MFNVKLPWREYGQVPKSADYFNQTTLDVLGFFNIFSLCISILTLTFSSFDRYLAVRFPMKYKNSETGVKVLTIVSISMVWILALFLAITPWLKGGMRYVLGPTQMVVGVIPGADENFPYTYVWTEIFYAAIIATPLVVVWIVNSATIWEIIGDDCCAFFRTLFCCDGRFCKTAPRESRRPSAFGHVPKKHQKQTFEIRIAKTFLSMTAAFTLSLLPMGLVNLWFYLDPESTNPHSLHFNPRLSAAREFFDLFGNYLIHLAVLSEFL
ncbi:Oidioi.mRNA.OKI2018_I69.chr2.g5006.t1.cds [Oikopleura dioica]|uniref:Oidioi.mRNA.OKI2018_I69.chr2.g5006.t1.cds n=1 Tax=Oikopleura dioica TaxID=34765 RepID=A0ABN7T5S2_OIKDI|nr:Oidioi.mRNA.OKI2018_I69.chr2.g5006.t1.cds [Oikopleura dioica]